MELLWSGWQKSCRQLSKMYLVKPLFTFFKNSYGVLNKPYITFREISFSQTGNYQIVYLHLLVLLFFIVSSALKTGIRNPFLLTLKFNSLYFSFFSGFLLMFLLFYLVNKIFNRVPFPLNKMVILWSYSLLPTLLWFIFTSIMYLLLPPPRTLTYPGKIYSLLYLIISLTLLFWKLILYYLTLRFGLKFDLFKILKASLIIFPILTLFSIAMYRLNIFKIPFL